LYFVHSSGMKISANCLQLYILLVCFCKIIFGIIQKLMIERKDTLQEN